MIKKASKSFETVAAGRKARNLVRGALAMLKMPSTPDAKRLYWIQERRANFQIHRAIGLANKVFPPIHLRKQPIEKCTKNGAFLYLVAVNESGDQGVRSR